MKAKISYVFNVLMHPESVKQYDYGKRGVVYMDGRKNIATIRPVPGGVGGWMLTWHDRTPYTSSVSDSWQVNCRHFKYKRDAIREVKTILQGDQS